MNSCEVDLAARGRFELAHLEGGPYDRSSVPVEPGQQSIRVEDLSFIQAEGSTNTAGIYQRSEKMLPAHSMVRVFQFHQAHK